jgi:hypothetical protein
MTAGPVPVLRSRGRAVAPTMNGSAFEECRFRAAAYSFEGAGQRPFLFDPRPASGSAIRPGSHAVSICLSSDAAYSITSHSTVKRLSKI